MSFEFATATRIIFGGGQVKNLGAIALELGKNALVLTGRSRKHIESVLGVLAASAINMTSFIVEAEPTVELIQAGVALARQAECDLIISLGGGSVIDAGKAIAALVPNAGEPLDYLEVIGRGQPLHQPPLPFIAVPTTAGTGAEVTRNAVLASPAHQVKVSLRHPAMLPTVALVDPELTYSMPLAVTASTGMDALTQLLEPFVSPLSTPLTDALCREGLPRVARSLAIAYQDGHNVRAREDMALASLFGGLALANAKLGAVHGFAGVLGGRYHAPHGAVCAALLPHVMAVNIQALREREPDHPALARYQEAACLLTGQSTASLDDGLQWVTALAQSLRISSLAEYGLQPTDIPEIVAQSADSSSMQGNPIQLTKPELETILQRAG
jgi:alcohol dehydrogenase class IV